MLPKCSAIVLACVSQVNITLFNGDDAVWNSFSNSNTGDFRCALPPVMVLFFLFCLALPLNTKRVCFDIVRVFQVDYVLGGICNTCFCAWPWQVVVCCQIAPILPQGVVHAATTQEQ